MMVFNGLRVVCGVIVSTGYNWRLDLKWVFRECDVSTREWASSSKSILFRIIGLFLAASIVDHGSFVDQQAFSIIKDISIQLSYSLSIQTRSVSLGDPPFWDEFTSMY